MKKSKKKKPKTKKTTRILYSVLAGIVLGFLVLGIVSLSPARENLTGSSVYVKYYGVSNYPLNKQAGNIQTFVKLDQPTLKNLVYASTTIEVANNIVSAADFVNGAVGLYQGSPPAPVPTNALDAVITAAGYITDYFKQDTACLRKIGEKYGSQRDVSFVLVSKLAYKQCTSYSDWLVAYIQHNYYTYPDGKFICRQDSKNLFAIKMGTGETSTNTWGC